MARDINFLRERLSSQSKVEKQDKVWLRYSEIGLGAALVIAMTIFGVRVFFNQRLSSIDQAKDQARQAILDNESVEKSYVILVNKLGILTQLFAERQNKKEAIQFFSTIFGPDVLVKQIEFNAEENIISFGLQSKDVFVLERVFNQLTEIKDRPEYSKVSSSTLRRTDEGAYELKVTVTLQAVSNDTKVGS